VTPQHVFKNVIVSALSFGIRSTMTEDNTKAIRIIPFSGKDEDWNRWSKTFLATATIKGYREILQPNDPTTEIDKKGNMFAYNDLVLSCQDDVTFGIIDESISQDYPDGDARLAWSNLKKRFEPNTGAAKVQLKLEFSQLKLENVEEDPDPWMTMLELKRRRLKTMGVDMKDEDLILHILSNLPKEYEVVIEMCEENLSSGTLSIATLKERIRARFQRLQKSSENKEEAIGLFAKKQFKKSCTVCGKIGHKGDDCFTLEKNKEKKEAYMKRLNDSRNKTGRQRGRWGSNNKNKNKKGMKIKKKTLQ
jgi:hypothetical protein